jgi:hypothetical protein
MAKKEIRMILNTSLDITLNSNIAKASTTVKRYPMNDIKTDPVNVVEISTRISSFCSHSPLNLKIASFKSPEHTKVAIASVIVIIFIKPYSSFERTRVKIGNVTRLKANSDTLVAE